MKLMSARRGMLGEQERRIMPALPEESHIMAPEEREEHIIVLAVRDKAAAAGEVAMTDHVQMEATEQLEAELVPEVVVLLRIVCARKVEEAAEPAAGMGLLD
jgi:hypothetical protein